MLCLRLTDKDRFIAITHGGETLIVVVRLESWEKDPILVMLRGPHSFEIKRASVYLEDKRHER